MTTACITNSSRNAIPEPVVAFYDEFEFGSLSQWDTVTDMSIISNPYGSDNVATRTTSGTGSLYYAGPGIPLGDAEIFFKIYITGNAVTEEWYHNGGRVMRLDFNGGTLTNYRPSFQSQTIGSYDEDTWLTVRLYDMDPSTDQYKIDINDTYMGTFNMYNAAPAGATLDGMTLKAVKTATDQSYLDDVYIYENP